ncbi:amidohydrolase family protein [Amycolatopsis acidiphila]|uniref:Amidohydrolase family protein n=1 Tax=Amycolatopsis acidiphila TaxID=715473 RepID=A0A558AN22_9PSEU|nr:amidohydrolase family protein [Amycolatopsis acidiphila]TVT25668.1 amidohydrolase family protein [Amycolatopsis acidiphila]UIJ60424.1 amidohydrolase family protein [Amycolatopsis acidiphila]GHG90241.1 aminoacylase [Amycolatopsis acidiphila]
MVETELWLRGALVVDGTGEEPFLSDVGIAGDKISEVVRAGAGHTGSGPETDCAGLLLAPGFIDLHTHSDLSFLLNDDPASKIMQGVTTDVIGNCGFSAFPIHEPRRDALVELVRGLGVPAFEAPWSDFDGYARALAEHEPLMNLAPLVGHGALRIAAVGTGREAVTQDLLGSLCGLLEESLEQGAFGMSTGLTYVPSGFAEVPEIHVLGAVLRKYDALYATHARAAPGFDSVGEALEVGRQTGVRVQYSHVAINDPRIWGTAEQVLRQFENAVESGVDVRYDIYPYDGSASSLTQYLPAWVQEHGEEGIREQLADGRRFEQARRELSEGLFGDIPWDWERVMVSLAGPGDEELEGMSIASAARGHGMSPEALCLDLCARHGNRVQVVLFYRAEADVEEFLAHPLSIIGSDGNAMPVTAPGRPHPRSFGTHARLLERYVQNRKLLSLSEAVHKSTAAAADRLGMRDRGRIRPGAFADLVALDLADVRETATWTRPCSLATGVRHVWVNGERVVADGALTTARPGRVLRRC